MMQDSQIRCERKKSDWYRGKGSERNSYGSDGYEFGVGGGEGCFKQDLEMSSLFLLSAVVKQNMVNVRDTEYGGMLAD